MYFVIQPLAMEQARPHVASVLNKMLGTPADRVSLVINLLSWWQRWDLLICLQRKIRRCHHDNKLITKQTRSAGVQAFYLIHLQHVVLLAPWPRVE